MTEPTVSVVTATYNRSDVLVHAIDSVIAQSFADWELIVVGDACTDDTAERVASVGDDRIRFVNRRENHGEQSVPNNEGAAMARGRFIAFLNHDDMWYPDHLESGLATLRRSGADLVYSLRATLAPDRSVDVHGADAVRRRRLLQPIPASTWICRRELLQRVGGWRSAFELRLAPSQDWLVRALDDGADLVGTGSVTVLMVPSGVRDNSYVATDPGDTEAALELLTDDARRELRGRAPSPPRTLRAFGWRVVEPLLMLCGQHPYVVKVILNHGLGRGAFIRRLRRRRGLAEMPKRVQHG